MSWRGMPRTWRINFNSLGAGTNMSLASSVDCVDMREFHLGKVNLPDSESYWTHYEGMEHSHFQWTLGT